MAFENHSRDADKFVVRLPDGMRDQVATAANADDRSMNSLIVKAIREYLEHNARASALLDALTLATVAKGTQHDAA